MTRTALITGISGQDGAYLAEFLLAKGYRVVGGMRRPPPAGSVARLNELGIAKQIEFVDFDLAELTNILRTLERVKPDEIYNLGAQTLVGPSFEQPIYTSDIDGTGVLRILEAVRQAAPAARFYQASTSEMFGKAQATLQDETTPFYPRSPYAIAKLFAHWATVNYRESFGLHASAGILFNHESPLRGRGFVSRKISLSLAQIRAGTLDVLELGNMDAKRDWGFAGDYVRGMWLMLQQEKAEEFVLATGQTHTVRDFATRAASRFGYDIEWVGAGQQERGVDRGSGATIVRVNPTLYRPADEVSLIGNAKKANTVLGWTPAIGYEDLITLMTNADSKRVQDHTELQY